MSFNNTQFFTLVGLGVGAFLLFRGKLKKLAASLDPTSQENAAYTTVNRVGQMVSENEHWNLGGWFYDVTHRDPLGQTVYTREDFPQ